MLTFNFLNHVVSSENTGLQKDKDFLQSHLLDFFLHFFFQYTYTVFPVKWRCMLF